MSNLNKTLVYGLNEHDTSTAMRISNNGELLISTKAADRQRVALYNSGVITTTTYACLVDLSQELHKNYVSINNINVSCKMTSNSSSADVKIGVITRIDILNSDISWLISVPFTATNANTFINFQNDYQPSSINFELDTAGELLNGFTNDISTNVALVNTALTLPGPMGAVTPAVGDIIIFFGNATHNFSATVSAIYHTD
jgi:hypothetical protein